ncbi:MAG TPA: hypothetical protein VMV18_09195, partial [bacterium]|nr:hypothetical protein [bacterium]
MKSWIAAFTVGAFVANVGLSSAALAAPRISSPEPVGVETSAAPAAPAANAKPDAGGITPCLLECYLGPRVGAEYNEGRNFSTMEILQLVANIGRIILAAQAYQGKTMTDYAKENALDSRPLPSAHGPNASKGGISACLIACYLGPRVAFEHNEGRKIRTYDILRLILNIGGILESLEAY